MHQARKSESVMSHFRHLLKHQTAKNILDSWREIVTMEKYLLHNIRDFSTTDHIIYSKSPASMKLNISCPLVDPDVGGSHSVFARTFMNQWFYFCETKPRSLKIGCCLMGQQKCWPKKTSSTNLVTIIIWIQEVWVVLVIFKLTSFHKNSSTMESPIPLRSRPKERRWWQGWTNLVSSAFFVQGNFLLVDFQPKFPGVCTL